MGRSPFFVFSDAPAARSARVFFTCVLRQNAQQLIHIALNMRLCAVCRKQTAFMRGEKKRGVILRVGGEAE